MTDAEPYTVSFAKPGDGACSPRLKNVDSNGSIFRALKAPAAIFHLPIQLLKKNNLKRVNQKENNGQQKSVSPGFYI